MSAERISFPEEPLRRVSQEPKPTIRNQVEKDGQLYFWDNVLSFPDSWITPNKQIDLFPRFHRPSLRRRETIISTEPSQTRKQMYFWDSIPEVPENYIELNQERWIKAERGRISIPKKSPRIANFLHDRIIKFSGSEQTKKPIIVWSVLFDNPKTASSEYVYAERYPEDVKEEDKQDFALGIGRITEYATNFATREFLARNMNYPVGRSIADVYGKLADIATYRVVLGGTYFRMGEVERNAILNGKDYKGALLDALFKHDSLALDDLIADTPYLECSSVNELAIQIGKKRFKKPDIGKWLNKLEIEKDDTPVRKTLKNYAISVLAAGVFRTPGVIEISQGAAAFIFLETWGLESVLAKLSGFVDINNTALSMIPVLTVLGSLTPFSTLHELFHNASSDEKHMGMIPAELIYKKTTPYLGRLETKE